MRGKVKKRKIGDFMFLTLTNIQMAWIIIASIALVAIIGVVLYVKFRWFRKFLYELVLRAEEKIIGSKKGVEKKNLVIALFYDKIPPFFKFLISEEKVSKLIDDLVQKMNELLKEGANK